ncbi:MAG: sensor histidine kinase, partial [Planctomycetota bacterium]
MRSRRSWWLAYGVCAAVVLAALGWITVTVLGLERAEIRARTDAGHQESLRLALWRMDSWLASLLAREAARPYFDYEAFYPQQRAYSTLLYPIEPGEQLAPSPLLSYEPDVLSFHFQVGPDGRLTSPQVPDDRFRSIAERDYLSPEQIETNTAALYDNRSLLNRQDLSECVAAVESQQGAPPPVPVAVAQAEQDQAQQLRTKQELDRRKGTYQKTVEQAGQAASRAVPARQRAGAARTTEDLSVVVGSLVPFWSGGDESRLVFTREVRVGDESYFQGFLCDWPKLRAALLEEIIDLFADARLVPVVDVPTVAEESGTLLATIPVSLEVPAPLVASTGIVSPARLTLTLTWLAVLATLFAVAVTLRASVAFGERRSRFASAVTHELRTPLTTFRMYSEMLAEGMVEDADKRQIYLETLRDESGRLSTLVENVLAYARLEEGRAPPRPVPTTAGDLINQLVEHLRQRAESAGMSLSVENKVPTETPLTVDMEVVGQILGNLVDNACKYAAGADDRTIHVVGRLEEGALALCVRDHGPGVDPEHAKAIFNPFDRGARGGGDATPGVGLGLALARGQARDLGGDLVLDPSSPDGACFKL